MPLAYYIPVLLLYTFGIFNLVGIRGDLVLPSLSFFAIGTILFFIIRYFQVQRHFFRQNAQIFYWIFVVLLFLTYFVGSEIKGSKRWIDLYFFQLQTSEIFKVFFIAYLARLFSQVKTPIEMRTIFVKSLFFTLIPMSLIFFQPDLGSSIIIFSLFIIMVLLSPVPKKQVLIFFIVVLCLLPLSWFGLKDYQKSRIVSFMNPVEDISGASYNMTQAKIAIGSGSVFGKGLGMGKQSQLNFLPEYHTDFAFSSLVEQFGFIGGFLVLSLLFIFILLLFYRMYRALHSEDADDKYAFYYILGISTLIIVQATVNIGMNLGLLPVAGITLPFITYGGSSLLTFMIGLALMP